MIIGKIEDGIVLDHIKAGQGLKLYEILHLDELDCQVALIQNAESGKMGKKDILKIDKLIDVNLDAIGFVDPGITINIIRNNALAKRSHSEKPEEIEGFVKCRNPRCITSIEQEIPHRFKLTDRETGTYRCIYCDSKLER